LFSGQNQNEGNCQEFVDDILLSLSITNKFEGALGNFLDEMRSKGTCNICFSTDKLFQQSFGLDKKKFEFKSHYELDLFVYNLFSIDKEFKKTFPNEYSLLKSFDRAFWLKHFKYPENEDFYCLVDENNNCLCPFDNPKKTKSFL
jgi:hypothetical protein